MTTVLFVIFLTGVYPLGQAWQANRRTTLLQAVNWAIAAWAAWGLLLGLAVRGTSEPELASARYLALCLTGCASVAVLGARRPGVGAWNFVLLGLLAVMLLPLVEQLLMGVQTLDIFRKIFLAGTLAIGVLNYLPTRLGPAALLAGGGCTLELLALFTGETSTERLEIVVGRMCVALSPWVGWLMMRRRSLTRSEFDQLWSDFRDRFGVVWAQRLREQFNRSAANANWPVHLYWQGLHVIAGATLPDKSTRSTIVATLRALLKRFGPENDESLAA
jgi:hypothetical protein